MTEGDATRDRLEQELAQARAQRQQLIEDLGGADPASPDVGDQGDAAQELEGLDDLSRLNRRVDELQRRIADPDAYPESGLPDGTVVTVRFPDGDQTTYRVVTIPGEAPGSDEVLTADSPLGQALIGRQAGDTVTYAGPDGDLQAEVVSLTSG